MDSITQPTWEDPFSNMSLRISKKVVRNKCIMTVSMLTDHLYSVTVSLSVCAHSRLCSVYAHWQSVLCQSVHWVCSQSFMFSLCSLTVCGMSVCSLSVHTVIYAQSMLADSLCYVSLFTECANSHLCSVYAHW